MAKRINYAPTLKNLTTPPGGTQGGSPNPPNTYMANTIWGKVAMQVTAPQTTSYPHIMVSRPPVTVPMVHRTTVNTRRKPSTPVVSLYGVNFLAFKGVGKCCQCEFPANFRIQSSGKLGKALYKKDYRYVCSSGCFRKALLNALLQGIVPLDEETHKMLGLDESCQDNVTEKVITDVGVTDKHAKMTHLKISNTGRSADFPFELQVISLRNGTFPIHLTLKFTEDQFRNFINDNKAVLDSGIINRWWEPKEEEEEEEEEK